jgi:SsrA-binding protein
MKYYIKNKKAYYDYSILEEFESGVILTGEEVKSIKNGGINIIDSFVFIKDNEVFIKNLIISRYKRNHPSSNHEENRLKKLLLNKVQIFRLKKELQIKGVSCVPLLLYDLNNKIKVKIGIVKGKKEYDKRNDIKKREQQREIKNYA